MKTPHFPRAAGFRRGGLFQSSVISLCLGGALAVSASAGTYQWDADLTPGTPSGGTGTWNAANLNWSDGANDVAWPNVVANNDIAVFANTAGTVTLGSALTTGGLEFGKGGYVLTGTSNLTLNSQTTLTGGILVGSGLSGISISLPVLTVTAAGSGTLIPFTNTDSVNFNSTIVAFSGSRQISLSNSDTLATTTITNFATANNASPGGTTIQLQNGNLTLSNLSGGVASGALAVANSTSTTAELRIAGTGAGTVTLNGNNTLFNNAGVGTLSFKIDNANATLALGHDNALGALNASSVATDTVFNLNNGTVIATGGARIIANNANLNGNITIGGSNDLTLTGSITETGGNRKITVNNSAATTLTGSFYLANDDITTRTFTTAGTGDLAINGVIANNNFGNTIASSLTKTGAGVLKLGNAANTYTGITTISSGTLSIATLPNGGVASPLGNTSNAATNLVISNNAILRYTGVTATSDRGYTAGGTGSTIEVTNPTTTLTLSGTVAGITKAGAGTLELSSANGWSNATVNAGTLLIANPTSQGISGTLTINTGGTLKLGGVSNNQVHDNTTVVLNDGGFLDMAGLSEKVRTVSGGGTVINSGGTPSVLTVSGFSASTNFDGIITGNVALTHTDALSTTTLNGLNTYSGNTSINSATAGFTLSAGGGLTFYPTVSGSSNRISGTAGATIALDGQFTFDLSGATIADGNSWQIVSASLLPTTTYGGTFSVAGFTESSDVWTKVDGSKTWTFAEATGMLSLAVSSGSGFGSWIGGFGLALADQDPGDDPDHDGFSNLAEYVLGGVPSASNSSIAPTGIKSGSNYIFTFKRSDLSEGDATTSVEYGNNLTVWGSYPVGVTTNSPVVITEAGGADDTVTVTIPTAGATKFFARLKVVK